MTLSQMLSRQVPVRSEPGARARIRRLLLSRNTRLVVADDDPTGTQTVHDVPVYLSWDERVLTGAFRSKEPVFYISTNSRALNTEAAVRLGQELAVNLRKAAKAASCSLILCSRSDSTLRGHYPQELQAMSEGLETAFDGVVIAPAFFEGGRYTIEDIHWVKQDGVLVAAHETEFAKDPSFGYRESHLKRWVEEKTQGKYRADQVLSVSLALLREGGPARVAELLKTVHDAQPIVVNAACYEDLEVFTLALLEAEAAGRKFIYRTAASFVKVRGGLPDRPLLTGNELQAGGGPGLVVVGSYVQKTTRQLELLLASKQAAGLELNVSELLDPDRKDMEIERVKREAEGRLAEGRTAAIYTSRQIAGRGSPDFLSIGSRVMNHLCQLVRSLEVKPAFFIAKGGITSIELARSALGVTRAKVLGQIIEGVPVWELDQEAGRWRIPYIVFPGNVGDEQALLRVVKELSPDGGKK